MSCSYGIIDRPSRSFAIVNAGPDDRIDVLLDLKPETTVSIKYDYEDINRMLFNDEAPYKILWVAFTAVNGSVVNATLLNGTGTREDNDLMAIDIAQLVLRCDRYFNGKLKSLERSVKVRRLGKEEELCEEICIICHGEYQVEDMMGTIECKHRFHPQCIINWLRMKENCPICRAYVVVR